MLNNEFIIKKIGQYFLHTLFWFGVLLFYTYFFGYGSTDIRYVLSFSLFLMPITIATTYVSIYKLIPDYLITKRYFLFALYSIYTLIISGYLIVVSIFFGLIYLSNFKYDEMPPISKSLLFVMIGVYLVCILVSAIKLLKLNLKQVEKTSKLETKILEAQLKLKEQELSYLKMQIHPHFLFNTLNTMYGFALKKSDKTPELIIKLSNLLDYILYQVDKPFVPFTEEIDHIRDYIALEQMRFNETLNIELEIDVFADNTKIAPMVLLPFVENSFKHGKIIDGALNIEISICCEGDMITFNIKNTASKTESQGNGIGLDNIKKRLEFLYANNYELTIDNSENFYEVNLKLNTTESFAK
mgnify:CR=1 FL=1